MGGRFVSIGVFSIGVLRFDCVTMGRAMNRKLLCIKQGVCCFGLKLVVL